MSARLVRFALLSSVLSVLPFGLAHAGDGSTAAALPWSGHVEGYFGLATLPGVTVRAAGGTARANASFAQKWNAEGEIFGDSLFNSAGNLAAFGGAAHLYWRDPSSHALGGFITTNGLWGDGNLFATHTRVGGQAQAYLDNVTLYGQAWYGQERTIGNPVPLNEWGGRSMVRWFANDNLRFDGEVTWLTVSGGGIQASGIIAALQANYRFTDKPVSVFARYQVDHPMQDAAFVGDLHRFTLGARWSFGSSSLKEEDRYGATMEAPTRIIHFFAR